MTAPAGHGQRLRAAITGPVAALCLVIFLADVVAGIIIPSFSLYARDLGVSLALLGAINTLGGVTQLSASIPLGVFSDRIGRTRVIMIGLSAFLLAMLAFAVADGPWMIAVGRILQGVAVVATFQIGAAYLGDITGAGSAGGCVRLVHDRDGTGLHGRTARRWSDCRGVGRPRVVSRRGRGRAPGDPSRAVAAP